MLSALLQHCLFVCLCVSECLGHVSLFGPGGCTVCQLNCLPISSFHLSLGGGKEKKRGREGGSVEREREGERMAKMRQRPAVRRRTKSSDWQKIEKDAIEKSAAGQKMDGGGREGVQS